MLIDWRPMETAHLDGRMMLGRMPNNSAPLPICWRDCWVVFLNGEGPLLSLNDEYQPLEWSDLPDEHMLSGTHRDDFGLRGWRGTRTQRVLDISGVKTCRPSP
jgi:hypothetical protein